MRHVMILLAIALLALAGCSNDALPDAPVAPVSDNIAGQAVYGNIGNFVSGAASDMAINPDPALRGESALFTANDDAVWNEAWVVFNDGTFERVSLSGSTLGGNWLTGSVRKQLALTDVPANDRNAVLVYSCSRTTSGWDCHDNWQSMEFKVEEPIQPSVEVTATMADTAIQPSESVSMDFSAVGDGGVENIRYFIEWGDDTAQDVGTLTTGDSASMTHTYSAAGEYRVDIVAYWAEDRQLSDSQRFMVTVEQDLPNSPTNPDFAEPQDPRTLDGPERY